MNEIQRLIVLKAIEDQERRLRRKITEQYKDIKQNKNFYENTIESIKYSILMLREGLYEND